jgi:ATP-dependent DNA helicase DinG
MLRADPSDAKGHTEEIIEQLPALIGDIKGVLVLFSSRVQMRDVYGGLTGEWHDRILLQDDYTKHALIKRHKEIIDAGDCISPILTVRLPPDHPEQQKESWQ